MTKTRGILVSVAAAAIVGGLFPTPAQAVGMCPRGFVLVVGVPGEGADRNGNALVCTKLVGPNAREVTIDDR